MNCHRPLSIPLTLVTVLLTVMWMATSPPTAISDDETFGNEFADDEGFDDEVFEDKISTGEASDEETATEPADEGSGPSVASVTRRAIVVAAVYQLRFHPHSGEKASKEVIDALEDERFQTLYWFQTEGLWTYASEWEQQALRASVGSLTTDDLENVHALGDDLRTLLFALRLQPTLPAPNGASIGPMARNSLPHVGQSIEKFVTNARLVDNTELKRPRDVADLWIVRASIQQRIDTESYPDDEALAAMAGHIRDNIESVGLEPAQISDSQGFYEELARFTAHWAHQEGLAETPVEDDLPVQGRPFRDVDAFTKEMLFRQAKNRVHTLSWLMGSDDAEE